MKIAKSQSEKKKKKYKSLLTFLLSEVSRIKMYFPNNRYFSLKEGHTHVYIKETMRSPPTYTHPFSTPLTGECSSKVMTIPVGQFSREMHAGKHSCTQY